MSDAVPPGWYPDPLTGAPRWWTGREWAVAAGPVAVVQPPLPEGTTTGTAWIYVQAVLPLASILAMVPYLLSFQGYFTALTELAREQAAAGGRDSIDASPLVAQFGQIFAAFGVTSALSLLVYAAWVVLAWLDQRELRRRGIVRPFPWPWAFLSVVYPIGRAVVVRRRTGAGLAPLWVLIGVYVGSIVVASVLTAVLFSGFFAQLSTLSGELPTS